MYGKWFLAVFGLGALLLLIVALMTAFPALLAVVIGLLVGSIAVYSFSARRTRQVGGEHETATEERRQAGQTGRPSASGAPAAGEGDAEAAHQARLKGRSP
jgi:membrane protein implicated in regulation of membrane protease activity